MNDFLLCLERALLEETGIAEYCKSPQAADTLKRKLYETRATQREQGIDKFDVLSISISPHSEEILFIYKRPPGDSPPAEEEDSCVERNQTESSEK